jgi:hypothetical protein
MNFLQIIGAFMAKCQKKTGEAGKKSIAGA